MIGKHYDIIIHRRVIFFRISDFGAPSARPSPVNAIAVLSRADEIGAGRLDALRSAAAIAERYAADDRVRQVMLPIGDGVTMIRRSTPSASVG